MSLCLLSFNFHLNSIQQINFEEQPSLDALDRALRNHISAIEQRRGISFQVIAEIISFGDKKLRQYPGGGIG